MYWEDDWINTPFTKSNFDYNEIYHTDRSYISRPGDDDIYTRFGTRGLRPRCFNFQTDYYACLRAAKVPDIQCMLYLEDLQECRFRNRERTRVTRILQEMGSKNANPEQYLQKEL